MPAAFSPETHNHIRASTGVGCDIHSGTLDSALTTDPAYPLNNSLDTDPSLYSRIGYDNNASVAVIKQYAPFSAFNDKACRVVAALNCRIPPGVDSVQLVLTDASGTVDLDASRAFNRTELIPLQGETDRYDLIDVLDADVNAARLEIRWTLHGGAAGYVDVGYLWAGHALVLARPNGMASDWSFNFVDPAEHVRSRGGALIANTNVQLRRVMSCSVSAVTKEFALGTVSNPAGLSLRSLRESTGLSSPVLFVAQSDELIDLQTLSIYGAFTRFDEIKHVGSGLYASRFNIEQVR